MKKLITTLPKFLLSALFIWGCTSEDNQENIDTNIATKYTLTVSAGTGGTVSSVGGTFTEGTEVTITASASDGYTFSGWTGSDSSQATLVITADANLTLTANFVENTVQYSVNSTASEGGSVSSSGGTYAAGTEITITASANDGYTFAGWTGSESTQTSLNLTVSADLTLVANFTLDPVSALDKFELHYPIDVKEVSQTEIENIYSTSAAKMNSRNAEILTIIYPIGDYVSDGGNWDAGFNTFETILDADAISAVRTKLTEWFTTNTDIPSAYLSDVVEEYMVYVEGGADLSSHFGVTESARLVMIAAPPSMGVVDFKKVIIHELYHAFQQDLESDSCRDLEEANDDSNSKWLIEGTAEYFAQTHAEELGFTGTGRSALLQIALGDYDEQVSEGAESPAKLGANATTAAAAMYLMVLKGYVQESVVFDGSMFYNCERENEYGPSNTNLQFIKDNWFKINSDNGAYSFQSEILN